MLPLRVKSEIQKKDHIVQTLSKGVNDVDPLIQNVYSNHVVLLGAGLVEISVAAILSDYSAARGCLQLSRFVQHSVERNNSLNCEKISNILNRFDAMWWREILNGTTNQTREAVDSLKTLRDSIAHGKPNGTGFQTVKQYYFESKKFVNTMADVVNT